jgi:hypothetical protein
MVSRLQLIFCHGVQNILVNVFTSDTLREVNRYREQLFERAAWVMAGSEMLADYSRMGWRARLLGAESMPMLRAIADQLRNVTPAEGAPTLYWTIVSDAGSPWRSLLVATQQAEARTQAEAIRALYSEDIPPATLYLAFGKPMISLEILPPLLIGQLQCYWSQQPGYTLTEEQLRTILYDYAYVRPTWQEEKLERAKMALTHRKAWEEGPILGLGMRLGPFWCPAPMSSPAWSPDLTPDSNRGG